MAATSALRILKLIGENFKDVAEMADKSRGSMMKGSGDSDPDSDDAMMDVSDGEECGPAESLDLDEKDCDPDDDDDSADDEGDEDGEDDENGKAMGESFRKVSRLFRAFKESGLNVDGHHSEEDGDYTEIPGKDDETSDSSIDDMVALMGDLEKIGNDGELDDESDGSPSVALAGPASDRSQATMIQGESRRTRRSR